MRQLFFLSLVCITLTAQAQIAKAPEIKEGDGPYTQLIIRGVTLINGTGAPPIGPVDIVVKQNRIVNIFYESLIGPNWVYTIRYALRRIGYLQFR